jgi:hypothetical protein
MWKLSVPVLLVGLCLAACGSSDANDQIRGMWNIPVFGVYESFDDGGEFVVALSPDLAVPFEWGTYTFDGEFLTLTNANDSDLCPNTSVTWTVEFSDDGDEAERTFVEDSCAMTDRGQDFIMIRESP